LVSAWDAAWDSEVEEVFAAFSIGWKCARVKAEKRSPTPEKYPWIKGTHWTWTIEVELDVMSGAGRDEVMQRRWGVSGSGCMEGGRAGKSHDSTGIELMTT
jgi:hypothetical protein